MVVGVKSLLLGATATLLQGVLAANEPFSQCGGSSFTGDVSCPLGYYCKVQNDYYSQCVSGAAPKPSSTLKPSSSSVKPTPSSTKLSSSSVKPVTTTTAKPISTLITSAKPSSSVSATPSTGAPKCTGTFSPISAGDFVAKMNPGWNLGNTLDAIQNEGDWNNPPVVATTFDDIKASGFKGVRLPITYAYHFVSQSPTWAVNATWLQRVSDVVDMVTARGLYTIVNVHHDSTQWADVTQPNANFTAIEERFYALWYQIGTKLACKSSLVAFEPINEPPGSTAADGAEINKLNGIFLQAINDAGGFNPQRVVTLVGPGEDGAKTSQFFKRPDAKFKNPWAIQYHYYSPYDFVFQAWGKTIWGSDADKASLEADIAAVRGNFTDVPLIIGEWAVSPVATEAAGRWRYIDFFTRIAAKYNTSTVLWDNGADFFDRAAHTWRDTVALDIYLSAAAGKTNSLPDSTTDAAATSQNSSAYIYHKANSSVTDVALPFILNGNTFKTLTLTKTGKALVAGSDYSIAGSTVTFKAGFLSTLISPSTAPGSVANITVSFSQGANLLVNVLQWNTPTLGSTSSKLPATSTDLLIPITWAGISRPAAVRAKKFDDTYVFDDWTRYLGPLQQGRMTYGNHWDWDGSHVILKAGVVDAVRAAGLDTVFTIEFYPRVPGNAVNYTLTV